MNTTKILYVVDCPNKVMISDPNDEELYHMKVNLETGKSENHVLEKADGVKYDDVIIPKNQGLSTNVYFLPAFLQCSLSL